MTSCLDCIHYTICIAKNPLVKIEYCYQFKNKADFVEVVRCKDCKYGDVSCYALSKDGKKQNANICSLIKKRTSVDYYCPCGERAVNYESSKTERE